MQGRKQLHLGLRFARVPQPAAITACTQLPVRARDIQSAGAFAARPHLDRPAGTQAYAVHEISTAAVEWFRESTSHTSDVFKSPPTASDCNSPTIPNLPLCSCSTMQITQARRDTRNRADNQTDKGQHAEETPSQFPSIDLQETALQAALLHSI